MLDTQQCPLRANIAPLADYAALATQAGHPPSAQLTVPAAAAAAWFRSSSPCSCSSQGRGEAVQSRGHYNHSVCHESQHEGQVGAWVSWVRKREGLRA